MSAKGQKLVIRLKGSEMELLKQASLVGDDDVEQVAIWAKETLLEAARSRAEASNGQSSESPKASPSRPKCGCGATASANGECDGSCIMRF